jgi:hypothetical protein
VASSSSSSSSGSSGEEEDEDGGGERSSASAKVSERLRLWSSAAPPSPLLTSAKSSPSVLPSPRAAQTCPKEADQPKPAHRPPAEAGGPPSPQPNGCGNSGNAEEMAAAARAKAKLVAHGRKGKAAHHHHQKHHNHEKHHNHHHHEKHHGHHHHHHHHHHEERHPHQRPSAVPGGCVSAEESPVHPFKIAARFLSQRPIDFGDAWEIVERARRVSGFGPLWCRGRAGALGAGPVGAEAVPNPRCPWWVASPRASLFTELPSCESPWVPGAPA